MLRATTRCTNTARLLLMSAHRNPTQAIYYGKFMTAANPMLISFNSSMHFRMFSSSIGANNNDAPLADGPKKPRTRKAVTPPELDANGEIIPKPKRSRKTAATADKEAPEGEQQKQKMYVLKFNSPILPYAKFPLT